MKLRASKIIRGTSKIIRGTSKIRRITTNSLNAII